MTLETLAKDIAASAEADAKAIVKKAKAESKILLDEAESKAGDMHSESNSRAEREAGKIAKEVVASARQSNQKQILIARRKALDSTHGAVRGQLSDPGFKGRASMLKSMMAQANKMAGTDYVIRPVEVDRKALDGLSGKRKIGVSVDGIGGFILEAPDASISYDMRFDTLLESTWNESLASVNSILFG